jgi:hypothetical protein
MAEQREMTSGPVFDNLDIDLVVKVLKHTVFGQSHHPICQKSSLTRFEGPFFMSLVPTLFIFQGYKLKDPVVIVPVAWLAFLTLFCTYCLFQIIELISTSYE